MRIHLKCGKPGVAMPFSVASICQGEIVIDEPLTGDMAQHMMDQFYLEHEHGEEIEPDDKEPETRPDLGLVEGAEGEVMNG